MFQTLVTYGRGLDFFINQVVDTIGSKYAQTGEDRNALREDIRQHIPRELTYIENAHNSRELVVEAIARRAGSLDFGIADIVNIGQAEYLYTPNTKEKPAQEEQAQQEQQPLRKRMMDALGITRVVEVLKKDPFEKKPKPEPKEKTVRLWVGGANLYNFKILDGVGSPRILDLETTLATAAMHGTESGEDRIERAYQGDKIDRLYVILMEEAADALREGRYHTGLPLFDMELTRKRDERLRHYGTFDFDKVADTIKKKVEWEKLFEADAQKAGSTAVVNLRRSLQDSHLSALKKAYALIPDSKKLGSRIHAGYTDEMFKKDFFQMRAMYLPFGQLKESFAGVRECDDQLIGEEAAKITKFREDHFKTSGDPMDAYSRFIQAIQNTRAKVLARWGNDPDEIYQSRLRDLHGRVIADCQRDTGQVNVNARPTDEALQAVFDAAVKEFDALFTPGGNTIKNKTLEQVWRDYERENHTEMTVLGEILNLYGKISFSDARGGGLKTEFQQPERDIYGIVKSEVAAAKRGGKPVTKKVLGSIIANIMPKLRVHYLTVAVSEKESIPRSNKYDIMINSLDSQMILEKQAARKLDRQRGEFDYLALEVLRYFKKGKITKEYAAAKLNHLRNEELAQELYDRTMDEYNGLLNGKAPKPEQMQDAYNIAVRRAKIIMPDFNSNIETRYEKTASGKLTTPSLRKLAEEFRDKYWREQTAGKTTAAASLEELSAEFHQDMFKTLWREFGTRLPDSKAFYSVHLDAMDAAGRAKPELGVAPMANGTPEQHETFYREHIYQYMLAVNQYEKELQERYQVAPQRAINGRFRRSEVVRSARWLVMGKMGKGAEHLWAA